MVTMSSVNLHWIIFSLLLLTATVNLRAEGADSLASNNAPITPLKTTGAASTSGRGGFLQQLKHSLPSDSHHWTQYYYYNFQYVKNDAVFFLVLGGNEALNASCATSDDMTVVQWAKKYQAAVYCLEHRFYGDSQPFNATARSISGMTMEELTYLNSREAVEDAAKFIKSVNQIYGTYSHTPRWVLFGGFYGGSIALWLRQKYPELSVGAVVSSAPVMAKVDLHEYVTAVEANYYRYDSACAAEIKQGFRNISQLLTTVSGRDILDQSLQQMLFSGGFSKHNFTAQYVMNIFYAMINNLALPSVNLHYEEGMKRACDLMANKDLSYVTRLMGHLENKIMTEELLLSAFINNGDDRAWMWQRCNEFGFMESTDAEQSESMFGGVLPTSFLIGLCQQAFNSTTQNVYNLNENVEATNIHYGGRSGYNGTNVILVRGDVDPYTDLQYYITSEPTIRQYTIPGLPRCADMYRSTSVNNNLQFVQDQIETSIQGWLGSAAGATALTSTSKQIIYQNNRDFSQLLASHTDTFMTDGIPSIRFPLPDPSNSVYMLNYPQDFSTGVFERTFVKHDGQSFTLNQRFWQNMEFYENGGPNFLILGGMSEASPKWILNAELPVMKLAKKYHAAVYLLEHRFYGKSIPTGGFTLENLQYLNIEQVMMDIKEFIDQNNFLAGENPRWILFGGSYAGSLAAWFRMKYGDKYSIGAVASSAPVDTPVDFFEYILWTEKAINKDSGMCSAQITKQFDELYKYVYASDGRQTLSSALQLQSPWTTTTIVDRTDLQYLFRNIITNYLFAAQFNGNEEMQILGGGVSAICKDEQANQIPIEQLAAALSNVHTYYHIDSTHMANNYTDYINMLRDTSADSAFSADRCRLYQMCNELGQFPSTDTGANIFGNILPINFYLNICMDVFGAKFTSDYIYRSAQRTKTIYGGKTAFKGTNVAFVNGDMDPWSTLSIRTGDSKNGIVAINIAGAYHCSDMYQPTSSDSSALASARIQINNYIADLLGNTVATANPGNAPTPPNYEYSADPFWYHYSSLSPILLIIMVVLACIFIALMGFILMQRIQRRDSTENKIVAPFMEASALPEKVPIPENEFAPVLLTVPAYEYPTSDH